MTLTFVATEHVQAYRVDQDNLAVTLEQLLKNDENILESLELRGDQLLEAVRGLQDVNYSLLNAQNTAYAYVLFQTLRRGIDDAVQKQFATSSLQTLIQRQAEVHAPPVTEYDWAVSSLEILLEGEVLGAGAFGSVVVGRWQGCRVAVKQLMRDTPRQVRLNLSRLNVNSVYTGCRCS